MIKHVVFFLEEQSMKVFLQGVTHRIFQENCDVRFHYQLFQGKQDLEKNLVLRMRNWLLENTKFIVIRDQDQENCKEIKRRLLDLCDRAGHSSALVRVACRELESFFLGDWQSVADAYQNPDLQKYAEKKKYRTPDKLNKPSSMLAATLQTHRITYKKVYGAEFLGKAIRLGRNDYADNRSHSFRSLIGSLYEVSDSLLA